MASKWLLLFFFEGPPFFMVQLSAGGKKNGRFQPTFEVLPSNQKKFPEEFAFPSNLKKTSATRRFRPRKWLSTKWEDFQSSNFYNSNFYSKKTLIYNQQKSRLSKNDLLSTPNKKTRKNVPRPSKGCLMEFLS